VRESAEDVSNLDGGGGAGYAHKVGAGSGMGNHVHSDAALAGALSVEHAKHDGGDGEDHDDLDRYGEGADERTRGTMDEIADNQFVHTATSVVESGYERRRGVRQEKRPTAGMDELAADALRRGRSREAPRREPAWNGACWAEAGCNSNPTGATEKNSQYRHYIRSCQCSGKQANSGEK
jgi:hypothetical protein